MMQRRMQGGPLEAFRRVDGKSAAIGKSCIPSNFFVMVAGAAPSKLPGRTGFCMSSRRAEKP